MPLETPRLLLRNISCLDRDFIYRQFSDESVNRYLFDAEPLSDISGADEIIDFYLQPEPRPQHRWILVRKSDSEAIGTCGVHRWDERVRTVDIGYDMQPAFWGHGYMREALEAVVAFAIDHMRVRVINACIYPDNARSIALAESLHFKRSGRQEIVVFRGERLLHDIYTLDCAAR